ncbi:PH domain-containing protein [Flavobacterium sp.]|uniref:PH domain-containing protein n=1 Tax=Flavobacterium sp. TaxID=239 RepID=UPI0035273935
MEEYTNPTVSFYELPDFESVSFQPLQKNYLNVVYLSNAIFSVVIAAGISLFIIFNQFVRENVVLFIVFLVSFIILLFWLSSVNFKRKGYALRNNDILYRRGILSTTTTIIPFNRIQHVAIHEGVFSRMYQLSELQVYTAGGGGSDLRISGLSKEDAERIKSFLLNKITVLENDNTDIEKPLGFEESKEKNSAIDSNKESENEIQ